jgi:glycosyltransferase involved in cell wall biosynthesis
MPRLAVVTSYFPLAEQPHKGHSAYQTLRRMQRWSDIEVFCPLARYPSRLHPRSFIYVDPDSNYSPPGLPTRYIRYPAVPLLSRPINGSMCARQLLPYLAKYRPDLILNYGVYPEGYAAVSVARTLGIPALLCAIGSDLNRIPDPISRQLTRKALRGASFVLAVSRQLEHQAIRLGAVRENTRTVPNGCDTSVFALGDKVSARSRLGVESDAQMVLFVGRIDATKGLSELLDACVRLLPDHPKLTLATVGDGVFREALERRASSSVMRSRVLLAGPCDSHQVARWLHACDVFCLPSYAEGCPNVVIEALACGRPVIGTNVGGIPDLIDSESGILVPPRQSTMLAEALHQALERDWDENAIARKFRRGWDQVAAETHEICLAAIAGVPSASREPGMPPEPAIDDAQSCLYD